MAMAAAAGQPVEHRFSPYTDNGGTAVGIACPDGAILIADKRLSKGYSIHTRENSKVLGTS